MRLTSIIVTLLLTATLASAAELDNAVAAMSGLEASFTQSFTPKGFKTAQSESGSVVFGTLPQMRWSYTRPEQKLFVFDGNNSWFYVPAEKQVTVGRLDDTRKRELPFVLLGDPASRDKHFKVSEASRADGTVVTLTPRERTAMIRSVEIAIDRATHRIGRVHYTDREGNETTFAFSGYHPAAAKADTFRFTPPPGVQVVQAQ